MHKGVLSAEAVILHVDMDSFYVSVELLDRPELRGLPVAVAHDNPRSVVSSASYEARRFGVRSAMPVSRAKNLCPELVLVDPHRKKYELASHEIMRIFETITPKVEKLSIDEAFLDVSGAIKMFGSPLEIAQLLRKKLREELGLPASVGIANSKFVAKLASEKAKPDGVFLVEPQETLNFLHALPVGAMWGVGSVTGKALESRAIRTVKDLAYEPLESLERIVGKVNANKLHSLAWGIDERNVETETREKSIGNESTFEQDLVTQEDIEKELLRLSSKTAKKLRDDGFEARTVAIKVRWGDFKTVTRTRTLSSPSNASMRFYEVAKTLFDSLNEWGRPVRLLGVRAENLELAGSSAGMLWDDDEKPKKVDETVDEISDRFGSAVVKRARLL